MNTIEIPQTGKKIEYPSSWEECTPGQTAFIFRAALKLLAGQIGLLDFRISVLYHLTGIVRKAKHNRKDAYLTEEQRLVKYNNIARAAETVDFVFSQSDNGDKVFDYPCVYNLFPVVRVQGRKYYGPGEALLNVTFAEYRVAYNYYRQFITNRDDNALNSLCAVLYRPARTGEVNEDIRINFNPYTVHNRTIRFRKLPAEIKFYILSWFAACDRYFKTSDLDVEGSIINLSPLFRAAPEYNVDQETANLGLTGILMAVAESGVFGRMDEVDRTNLYTVLLKLYAWHQESESLKKKYNAKSDDL